MKITKSASRLAAVLFMLLAATLFSWFIGHGEAYLDERAAGAVILAVAWFKARLIARDFMEIRHAPSLLRLGADIWLAALALALTGLSLIG